MSGRTVALLGALLALISLVVASVQSEFSLLDPRYFQLESKLIYVIIASIALGALFMFLLASLALSRAALNHAQTLPHSVPSSVTLRQAEIALQLGKIEEAVRLISEVPEGDTDYWFARKLYGDLEAARGNWDSAEKNYQESLKYANGPGRASVLFQLATLYESQEKSEQAQQLYQEALRMIPDAIEPLIRLRSSAVREQKWREALSWQEYLEKNHPRRLSDSAEEGLRVGIRYELGREEFESGQPKTALALIKYVLRLTNSFVPAYLLAGEINVKMENPSAALKIWEQGLQETENPALLRRISELFLTQNQPEVAIDFVRNFVRNHPENRLLEYSLADLYWKLEMITEAVKTFESVRARDPQWLLPQMALGDLYQRMERPEEAVRQYRRILDASDSQSVADWQCYICNTTYGEYRSFCLECLEWNSVNLNQNKAGFDFGHEKSTAIHP